jgi:hypothetical protein
MATTLKQDESLPASYPAVSPYDHYFSGEEVVDPAIIWQRLESYIAWRWTARAVVWTVEGPGAWAPPLTPVVGAIAWEVWNAAWEAVSVDPGPLGHCLEGGTYRATATIGEGEPPEAVLEAWRRLHEYSRGIAEQFKGDAALIRNSEAETTRGWTAKAMQLSGAADLLRPYRNLGVS